MDTYYTVKEVAEILKVSQMTIYRAVNSGKLASVEFGHTIRIAESALQEFMAPKVRPSTTPVSKPRREGIAQIV